MRTILLLCLTVTLLAPNATSAHGPEQKDEGGGPRDLPSDRGAYIAPPRSGEEVGESTTVGLKGLGLHFPALTLRLPTLTLPSLEKHRHRAHMLIEPSVAPFVDEVSREEYGVEAGSRDLPPPSNPRELETPGQKSIYQKINHQNSDSVEYLNSRDYQTSEGDREDYANASRQEQDYQRKLEELNRQLEECSKMSQLLKEALRNQAAASQSTNGTYGQATMGRLPSAALSQAQESQRRLPSIDASRNSDQIQHAAHWATTPPSREPALLERLPRDTMVPVPYPSTATYR